MNDPNRSVSSPHSWHHQKNHFLSWAVQILLIAWQEKFKITKTPLATNFKSTSISAVHVCSISLHHRFFKLTSANTFREKSVSHYAASSSPLILHALRKKRQREWTRAYSRKREGSLLSLLLPRFPACFPIWHYTLPASPSLSKSPYASSPDKHPQQSISSHTPYHSEEQVHSDQEGLYCKVWRDEWVTLKRTRCETHSLETGSQFPLKNMSVTKHVMWCLLKS